MPKVSKNSKKKNIRNLGRKMIGGAPESKYIITWEKILAKEQSIGSQINDIDTLKSYFPNSEQIHISKTFEGTFPYMTLDAYKKLIRERRFNPIKNKELVSNKRCVRLAGSNPDSSFIGIPPPDLGKYSGYQTRFINGKDRNIYHQRESVEGLTPDTISWEVNFPNYAPAEFPDPGISPNQYKSPGELVAFADFANPDDQLNHEKKLDKFPNPRFSYENYILVDDTQDNKYPLNPMGRTGLLGRGILGNWGCNLSVDPLVMFFNDKDQLCMTLVQRPDTGEWAIPGGMRLSITQDSTTVLYKEFLEECGGAGEVEEEETGNANIDLPPLEKLLEAENPEFLTLAQNIFGIVPPSTPGGNYTFKPSLGEVIYTGYVDDPRNTDNCWMETIAKLFFIGPDLLEPLGGAPPTQDNSAGEKPKNIVLTPEGIGQLYASHSLLVKLALENILAKHTSKLNESQTAYIQSLLREVDSKTLLPSAPATPTPAGPSCSGTKVTLNEIATFITGDEDIDLGEIGKQYACVTGDTVSTPLKKQKTDGGKKSHRRSSVAHKKSTGSHKSAVTKLFQASTKNRSKIPAKKSLKMVKVRSGRKA